jgi:PTH1 family peptidyl-tRNA hydrolase
LGTDAGRGLLIGVARPPDNWDPSDYVLSKFTKEENEEIELQVQKAADAAADWVEQGIQFSMNKYNP